MGLVQLDRSLPYALDTVEMDGFRCVFGWSNYDDHLKDHPMLEQDWFWPKKIVDTLQHPDLIVEGVVNEHRARKRHVYWKQFGDSYFVGGIERAARVKVVVEVSKKLQNLVSDQCTIISAWHIANVGKIKELGYTQCEVIYSNGRFCDTVTSRFKQGLAAA